MRVVYVGLSAAAAWTVGLRLIRRERMEILVHALAAGGLCSVAEYVLQLLPLERLAPPMMLAIFLLMVLVLSLERPRSCGDVALAFFASQAAMGTFLFVGRRLDELWPGWGAALALLLPAAFALAAVILGDRFPENDWREYFSGPMPENKRLDIRTWHIYTVMALACGLCTLFPILIPTLELKAVAASAAVMTALFWGAILMVILLIEYRRETLAALAEAQYRDEMRSFMDVIRSQRHDYNFHVQALSRMLRTGDLAACERYVDELVKDSMDMNSLLPVKDPAISALISNFRALAVREGVELHIDIQDDLSRLSTTVYETNKVISNLLQNAIDETRSHKDKSYGIHFNILKRGEFCVIQVSNAFPNGGTAGEHITDIYRHGYTTKPGHDGVGLSSVRTLLSRYKGVIYTQIDDGVITFTAKIPLRYTARNEDTMSRKEAPL